MAISVGVPISRVGKSYYIFDAPSVAHIRSQHGIPGLLTGTLPQASQQNVFYGLPLQLMPEEARVLVEEGVAYLVDERAHQERSIQDLESNPFKKQQWMATLQAIGKTVSEEVENQREAEKQKAIGQMNDKAKSKKDKRMREKETKSEASTNAKPQDSVIDSQTPKQEDQSLVNRQKTPQQDIAAPVPHSDRGSESNSLSGFFSASNEESSSPTPNSISQPVFAPVSAISTQDTHTITPTTSYPPFPAPSATNTLPPVPSSYPLFRHLHRLSYFLSPGLRFGCQYMAYPGDPLRFHSHFMVVGRKWDEEMDLLSIIGVGRLGTGVKKGVLLGGVDKKEPATTGREDSEEQGEKEDNVRCFCIEWSGM